LGDFQSLFLRGLWLPNFGARGQRRFRFDRSGAWEMKVSRGGKPLPLSDVANLQPGDRLWIHPDFSGGSIRALRTGGRFFARSTNPLGNWFTRAETLEKAGPPRGIVVTVPQDAQQALIFLAQSRRDFITLRSAVRDKPGVFVLPRRIKSSQFGRTRL